jgi:Glycosyl transferase family 2
MGTLTRLDRNDVQFSRQGILAFCVLQNELLRLPWVFHHHRALGVERFFFIDNGSKDGSVDYLLSQPDAYVFRTEQSYREARNGIDWIEELLGFYGADRWCLIVDCDEHLVYPESEHFPIRQLCDALENKQLNCLATMFIDMYSNRPILRTWPGKGQGLVEACSFFDQRGYWNFPAVGSDMPRIFGGPRARLFWPEVNLSEQDALLRCSLEASFDEQFYLARYPDVESEVKARKFANGLDHYRRHGRFEGRAYLFNSSDDWPEEQYVSGNPDIREAINSGQIASGRDHYLRFGQFERRFLSYPPLMTQIPLIKWHPEMKIEAGRHVVRGANWRRNDAVGGVLLHFKLMKDLISRSAAVEASGEDTPSSPHWGKENARYHEVLTKNPKLGALDGTDGPISSRYRDSNELLQLGLISPINEL